MKLAMGAGSWSAGPPAGAIEIVLEAENLGYDSISTCRAGSGDAEALVTLDVHEDMALVGPRDKIRDDLQRWEASCETTLLVSGPPSVLRLMAELC